MITDPTCDSEGVGHPVNVRYVLLAGFFLVVVLLLVYLPSFKAPFIFDDQQNIVENATLRSLWPIWNAFHAPAESGLVGRPLINMTLALNFAWSGNAPWSYHVVNLAIHLGATLLLWALLNAVMQGGEMPSLIPLKWRWFLPWTCALLWGIHPIQTQAVTYVIQRCESLMGLFFIATLFAYVRSWRSKHTLRWQALGLFAFLACLACKEVAVTMFPVALAMSWVLQSENPIKAIRRTPLLFFGIIGAIGCLLLAMIMGLGYSTHADHLLPSGVNYTVAQGPILLRYLRLAFWPSDLTLDYGWPVGLPQDNWLGALVVVALLVASVWLLWRRHWIGLLGSLFFLILAPTSLVPLPDPIFEHRMYLPMGAVVVLVVIGGISLANRWEVAAPKYPVARMLLLGFFSLSLPLGWRTYRRNEDYQSSLSIWSDTLRKRPQNFRAYHGVAGALNEKGDWAGSLPFLRRAALLNPTSFSVRNDLGIDLIRLQRPQEAIVELEQALKFVPTSAMAHNNLGAAFLTEGDVDRAIKEFQTALKLKPDYVSPRRNLELALANRKPQ